MKLGNLKKYLSKGKASVTSSLYYRKYNRSPLDEKLIFLESRIGRDIAGNVLQILLTICSSYAKNNFKIYVAAREGYENKIKDILSKYNLPKVKLVKYESVKYFSILAKAQYLVNDTTFPRKFIKKEGQIYLNTWHGTPLKSMGKDSLSDKYKMGNVQRNLLMTDYLVFPSEYCAATMVSAYCLNGLYSGKILKEGYPRNTIFFTNNNEIREKLNLTEKKIYVYMPTYRDQKINEQIKQLSSFFDEIDTALNENESFFVNLHYLVSESMDFSRWEKIKPFPKEFEVYQFINSADVLVTDYSSIFFDFANTRKKIVLFPYDKEEYLATRGLYLEIEDLPFPSVGSIKELLVELRNDKRYDDEEFLKKYCTFDNKEATQKIVQHVLQIDKVCQEESIYDHTQENVVMYCGNLAKNGITGSLKNLLYSIDSEKRNYYICWQEDVLAKGKNNILNLPDGFPVLPISSWEFPSMIEAVSYYLFYKKNYSNKVVNHFLDRLYKRELKRHFYGLSVDTFIQFAGYDKSITALFQRATCRKVIYSHSDMVQEIEKKNNQHKVALQQAYQQYDCVAAVSEDIIESIKQLNASKDNIRLVNNCHPYKKIIENSKLDICFQRDTICRTTNMNGINGFLREHKLKFITIGRFSIEKGHFRLIDAFEKFHKVNPEAGLIIIGGMGNLYSKTMDYIAQTSCWKDILVIRKIDNPMPILKKCDLFILSSFYEGLGLVLLEADCLGVPAISTNIVGPRGLMEKYGGYLVEDSEDGILQGMFDFVSGKVGTMHLDYEEYNRQAVKEFENLFC